MPIPSQWPQGNDHSLFSVQLTGTDGVTGVDLTGVSFSAITLALAPVLSVNAAPGPFTALTGSVTQFTDIANGKFTYKFTAADVASYGNYVLVVTVDYGGGDLLKSLPMPITLVRTV